MVSGTTVPLEDYSRALDEIWRLRAGAAYEAMRVLESLAFRTMPASARDRLLESVDRLRAASRGEAPWMDVPTAQLHGELEAAGAKPLLTRGQWEGEQH